MAMTEDDYVYPDEMGEPAQAITPCLHETELFFSEDLADKAKAKAICRTCPIRARCLRAAFRVSAEFGVWGGFDPIERGFYRKLYGTKVPRIQELPPSLVARLARARANRGNHDEG